VDFESEDWTKDWNGFGHKQNMRLVESQLSEHLGKDLSGKALEILVKKGEHYGLSGKFEFKEQYIKLNTPGKKDGIARA